MNPKDFWESEPVETIHAMRGYSKERTEASREEWERFRMLATTLVNTQVKKPVKAKDLWPFEWDKAELKDTAAPTPEDIKRIREKFKLNGPTPKNTTIEQEHRNRGIKEAEEQAEGAGRGSGREDS